MRVLSLDTTSRAGSVALVEDDRVIAERAGDPSRSHTERLPAEILGLLAAAAVPMTAVDLFAVAAGPGSFTGLRTGIATIQGLAFVTGRLVVAVSALETLGQMAAADLPPGAIVGAWIDAFRRDVFSALYRVTDAAPYSPERLVEIDAAAVGDPAATLERWRRHGSLSTVVGDGAMAYRDLLAPAIDAIEPRPLAAAIGRMAIVRERAGLAMKPAAVQALYIRRPDVEVERERKSGGREPGVADSGAISARGPGSER